MCSLCSMPQSESSPSLYVCIREGKDGKDEYVCNAKPCREITRRSNYQMPMRKVVKSGNTKPFLSDQDLKVLIALTVAASALTAIGTALMVYSACTSQSGQNLVGTGWGCIVGGPITVGGGFGLYRMVRYARQHASSKTVTSKSLSAQPKIIPQIGQPLYPKTV